ncbi:MAG: sigma-54-dependent transcriptional regulator [Thermodesulfobacteriota bacterium]
MTTGKKVLLAENDAVESSKIGEIFLHLGHHISKAFDGVSACEMAEKDRYDLVIAELDLPHINGMDLLRRIKGSNQSLPVILISSHAMVPQAVEAIKLGAHDFLVKPFTEEMAAIVVSQVSNGTGREERNDRNNRYAIITRNGEMKRLLDEARDIADSQASVFIHGESGTGKELIARYIHHNSTRRDKPFVPINCSALPESLLESELFGHEKGSFTGAVAKKKGKFEIADHGTLLLDEISEMEPRLQAKLLRVLQEREIDRVGGTEPIAVDVRVIATTNRDIEEMVKKEEFREDLYYRLNVIPFHLPPLRERKDDIPLLADYLVEKYNELDGKDVKGLTEAAMDLLMKMRWKGNVRELENFIERAVLLRKEGFIGKEELLGRDASHQPEHVEHSFIPSLPLKEMEKRVIFHALDKTNGNRTHAAEMLGISVRTLRNKLNEYREKMAA